MEYSAKIDSRLLLECLSEGGLVSSALPGLRAALAGLLTARIPSPLKQTLSFESAGAEVSVEAVVELLWDGVQATLTASSELKIGAPFLKYSQNFDEAIQQRLKFETGRDLLALDEHLKKSGASLEGLRTSALKIDVPIATALVDFYRSSVDRVIHEEICGLLVKPVADNSARILLGRFLLEQFPIPAKRVQRFTLCQALENLAEPELGPGLAALALDPQFASLHGRLCTVLAKSKYADAAAVIVKVLTADDDETKVWALEALGALRAKACVEIIRPYVEYQSAEKEWTRAINKAAVKTLKVLG